MKKTLVLQLARLGDIYQTWPVLRALKRGIANDGGELHLLVRDRFKGAAEGCEAVDHVWQVSTGELLAPLLEGAPQLDASVDALGKVVESLRKEGYSRIINLSFSPFSSRLVFELWNEGVEVRGYTRHTDGYLDIPDDASAYFYAQVGPGRNNRLHLTDLFAEVAAVELNELDWVRTPAWTTTQISNPTVIETLRLAERPIIVHVGASQADKSYPSHKWLQVVRGLLAAEHSAELPRVILVGSGDERKIGDIVSAVSSERKPVDLTGQTSLRELFELINKASLVIGADSAPVHIAALTGTPVLNLNFSSVSFWETGPRSKGSRILAFQAPEDLASDLVVSEALSMLAGREGDPRAVLVEGAKAGYHTPAELATSVEWEWIQALYLGAAFPVPDSELCLQGLNRLREANDLALEQLRMLARRPGDRTALAILDRFDEIIETIKNLVPTLAPLIGWFQTERIRLGPMPADQLVMRTRAVHEKLGQIVGLYANEPGTLGEEDRSDGYDDISVG